MEDGTARRRELLEQKARAFFEREAGVRAAKDPEDVHAMRTASRRLQEALRCTVPERARRKVFRRIRRVRRILGDLRDLDVLLDRVRPWRGGKDTVAVEGFIAHLESLRSDEHARVVAHLDGVRLDRLAFRVGRTIAALGAGDLPDLGPAVDRREQRFAAAVARAKGADDRKALHAARIEGKKVRYILEAAVDLGLGDYRTRIEGLKALQQHLGDWHDLLVLENHLVGFCADAGTLRESPAGVRALLERLDGVRQERDRHVGAFFEAWRRVASSQTPEGTSPGR